MRIEIELTSEQFQKLVNILLIQDGKIKHLKGRVRRLEENLDYLLNRVKTLEGSRTE